MLFIIVLYCVLIANIVCYHWLHASAIMMCVYYMYVLYYICIVYDCVLYIVCYMPPARKNGHHSRLLGG